MTDPDAIRAALADPASAADISATALLAGVRERTERLRRRRQNLLACAAAAAVLVVLGGIGWIGGYSSGQPTVTPAGPGVGVRIPAPASPPVTPTPTSPPVTPTPASPRVTRPTATPVMATPAPPASPTTELPHPVRSREPTLATTARSTPTPGR